MALADILLIALGWIIPGSITLVGVLLVGWYQQRKRQQNEDRLAIYQPLHKQMVRTLERGHLYKHGYSIENFEEDFWNIANRGALHPERLVALREDVEHLIQLRKEADEVQFKFRKAREAALEEAAEEIEILDADGDTISLAKLFGSHWSGHEWSESLSSGDRERFVQQADGRIQGAAASIPNGQPSPSEALYEKARRKVRKAHQAHNEASIKVLKHAEKIKSGLEKAIRSGARYLTIS